MDREKIVRHQYYYLGIDVEQFYHNQGRESDCHNISERLIEEDNRSQHYNAALED